MIFQKGINWNDYDAGKKRGRVAIKTYYELEGTEGPVKRSKWEVVNAPIFTKERFFLRNMIPLMPDWRNDESNNM